MFIANRGGKNTALSSEETTIKFSTLTRANRALAHCHQRRASGRFTVQKEDMMTNPKPKPRYEVIVGNVGIVYSGPRYIDALRSFRDYSEISKAEFGRASGESVVLFEDGEIVAEFDGREVTK